MNVEGSNFNDKIKKIATSYKIELNILLKFYKFYKKIKKFELSKLFLLKCRKFGFMPAFISNSTNKIIDSFKELDYINKKVNLTITNFHFKLLNLYIDGIVKKIQKFKRSFNDLESKVKEKIPNDIFKTLLNIFGENVEKIYSKICSRHSDKFDKLKIQFFSDNNIKLNDKWLINLTNLNIPLEVRWLLSLGKNFAVPTQIKNNDLFHIIADVESIL